jgi:diaminohydroxyphosphoribosylaminopyrimidine deaminase/5-amino-6-(5-phosphoribosylamino)uracil reductase
VRGDASPGDGDPIDTELMARAIAVSERGRRTAPPNPWVGCVVARDGTIVGEGFHVRRGEAHAEVAALAVTGDRARGATAYVTLEPCAHTHRTGPCAGALVDAGVARVVVAVEDPDPQVRGRGFAYLREHGVDVDVGVGAADARRSLAPYLHHRRTGRAFGLLKTAMTLDARTAAADGTSQWITGEAARDDAHDLRAESQAVIVGSGTALADQPALTVRGVSEQPAVLPWRVLLDARGRVPATGPLFDAGLGPTMVMTTEAAPSEVVDTWRSAGAKIEMLPPGATGGVDLRAALELLGREEVLQAMVEGGATVHASLLADGLADGLAVYVAPTVLGSDARAAFPVRGPSTLADADGFVFKGAKLLGDDVRLDYLARGER